MIITDSIGCQAHHYRVDLILNPNPSIALTASDVLCYGESNGAVIAAFVALVATTMFGVQEILRVY